MQFSHPLALLCALALISAVGVLDINSPTGLSFAAFYVLITVAVTVRAGLVEGLVAALMSATVWEAADAIVGRTDASAVVMIWNGAVRFVITGIVVLLIARLIEARQAARQSEANSRAFLASAAHQLRTPIAALSASVEALLLQGSSPDQERLLTNAASEASRLGRLVTALLRTARLDQGEATRAEPVDLVALAQAELDRARLREEVDRRLLGAGSMPGSVVLDPEATGEALANLLDNAARHAVSFVEVRLGAGPREVTIAVADDGPGLPPGTEARAFERFETFDGRGGTGLGLAIARDLARRQDGDLVYEAGVFILRIPLAGDRRPRVG